MTVQCHTQLLCPVSSGTLSRLPATDIPFPHMEKDKKQAAKLVGFLKIQIWRSAFASNDPVPSASLRVGGPSVKTTCQLRGPLAQRVSRCNYLLLKTVFDNWLQC